MATGESANRVWLDPKPQLAGPQPLQQFPAALDPGRTRGALPRRPAAVPIVHGGARPLAAAAVVLSQSRPRSHGVLPLAHPWRAQPAQPGRLHRCGRWLPHPHLRPQLDALVTQPGSTTPDPRIRVFHQEQLNHLEQWLSDQCGQTIRLNQHNPARRPLDLSEAVLNSSSKVRWLYAMDQHAFGYAQAQSSPLA